KGKPQSARLDSLLFSHLEFDRLFGLICRQGFDMAPSDNRVFIAECEWRRQLKQLHSGNARKRWLFVAYVSIMLVFFMGRTSARNYLYNEAKGALHHGDYAAAGESCRKALAIDQSFHLAWDRLARCEYKLKETAHAQEHWQKALALQPDLVSAK